MILLIFIKTGDISAVGMTGTWTEVAQGRTEYGTLFINNFHYREDHKKLFN